MKLKSHLMAGVTRLALPARAHDGATTLAATVDSLDAVPEALHGFYAERDGKFHLQVSGLPAQGDVTRLSEALRKERADHKIVKDQLSGLLAGRTVEDVQTQLDRIPELEAAQGQIDEEKLNTLVEARIKTRLGPVERERDQLRAQNADKDKAIEGFTAKERTRTIHDKVREDAVKAKLLPEAVEDALMLADRVMEVDEAGNVVTKDNVGVTPGIGPSVWLTDMQKSRPHWWGPSQGGGAGGNRGGGGGGEKNPFTHENWNLTEQGALVQTDRTKAEQFAKTAGTTIGGPRPEPRK